MAVDLDEFDKLFGTEETPLQKVQKVFPGAEEIELKPRKITWKGQTEVVYDYELFVMTIKQWCKDNNWTKEKALDEWFDMAQYG